MLMNATHNQDKKLNELLEEFGFFDVFRKLFGDKKKISPGLTEGDVKELD